MAAPSVVDVMRGSSLRQLCRQGEKEDMHLWTGWVDLNTSALREYVRARLDARSSPSTSSSLEDAPKATEREKKKAKKKKKETKKERETRKAKLTKERARQAQKEEKERAAMEVAEAKERKKAQKEAQKQARREEKERAKALKREAKEARKARKDSEWVVAAPEAGTIADSMGRMTYDKFWEGNSAIVPFAKHKDALVRAGALGPAVYEILVPCDRTRTYMPVFVGAATRAPGSHHSCLARSLARHQRDAKRGRRFSSYNDIGSSLVRARFCHGDDAASQAVHFESELLRAFGDELYSANRH